MTTRTLVVGNGAREAALAAGLARSSEVSVLASHANPSLVTTAAESGGSFAAVDILDGGLVAEFAAAHEIDLAVVSSDAPLAAGVVDALQARGVLTMGATQAAAELEWNKAFSRKILDEVDPTMNPRHVVVSATGDVANAVATFDGRPFVVKPSGLTGGKGVKVMGPHLRNADEAATYARQLLDGGDHAVLLEEKIEGPEFTIQAITDGSTTVFPPATYDYPYRFDGDTGPGTGGMGSFSLPSIELPFMTPRHYAEAQATIQRVLDRMRGMGRRLNGVVNAGFFVTDDGLRVIEFNARFGDPECMNIMAILDDDWLEIARACAEERLDQVSCGFRPEASIVVYLVPPSYGSPESVPCEFGVDVDRVRERGTSIYFASSVATGAQNGYVTIGGSRAVAVAAAAPSLEQARTRAVETIESEFSGALEWRRDIGAAAYVDALAGTNR